MPEPQRRRSHAPRPSVIVRALLAVVQIKRAETTAGVSRMVESSNSKPFLVQTPRMALIIFDVHVFKLWL